MRMMITEVYEAFKEAGASDGTAQKAAKAIAADSLATKGDIARIEKELSVMKRMLGIVIAAVVLPLIRDFMM